jgi:hypothetical protein
MHTTNHPLRRGLRRRRAAVGALVLAGALTAAAIPATTLASTATAAQTSSPLTVLTSDRHLPSGDLFLTLGSTAYIVSPSGYVVWSTTAPTGDSFSDFRVQRYEGQPVLTLTVSGTATGPLGPSGGDTGTDYILNDHYQQIATVEPGAGYSFDGHEFWITPQDTAWITATQKSTANLTSIGGAADQTVTNGIAQEIDIKTGKVLFEWNSADHVPYSQSEQPLPASPSEPWDWFHINAVKLDTDGNLLIDARDTWTAYKVNRHSGQIIWQLGGKASSFKLQAAPGQSLNNAGEITAWQHDFEAQGNGIYTFFDNESAGVANTGTDSTAEYGLSRAVTVKVDTQDHTATLVKSFNQPDALTAPSQGNAQRTADGNTVVGWGSLPYFSEFDPDGDLLYNAEFPAGVNSYRAYLLPWNPGSGNGGHPGWPGGGGPSYHPGRGGPSYDRGHGSSSDDHGQGWGHDGHGDHGH